MVAPTTNAVRANLPNFDWESHNYGPPSGTDADPLDAILAESIAYIEVVTWRPLDATMPDQLAAIALQATALRAAQLVVQGEDDYVGTVNDDSTTSFSVGPYSETRRDPTKTPAKGALLLNWWPQLNDLLWLLLNLLPGENNPLVEERWEYWWSLLSGQVLPAWQLVEVDWRDSHGASWWGFPGPTVIVPD